MKLFMDKIVLERVREFHSIVINKREKQQIFKPYV
jgi:hypothetical protein